MYARACMRVRVYARVYVYVRACMYVCVLCVFSYVYVCMCVCVCGLRTRGMKNKYVKNRSFLRVNEHPNYY